jgi:hypothetical protein
MSKTKTVEAFKAAITSLGGRVPKEDAALVKQAERTFVEMRQHASTLQARVEQLEAELAAARQEALASKAEAYRLRQQAESLAQKGQRKAEEVSRLQKLLLQQTGKGYHTEMIKDFLDQLEADLIACIYENEHLGVFNPAHTEAVLLSFQKYGQEGRFVPLTTAEMARNATAAARATMERLTKDCRAQDARRYRSELEHLTALKERFAHALECCRRPQQQFISQYHIATDGSIDQEGEWVNMEEWAPIFLRAYFLEHHESILGRQGVNVW